MIAREDWIALTVELLRQLSDPEYQERVWVRAEGPEVGSWDETVNLFLDNVNPLGFMDDYSQTLGLTSIARNSLLNLERALSEYTPPKDARMDQIIVDQRWRRIQDRAAQALAAVSR